MTPEEFEEAEMQYKADVEMYEAAMGDFSEKRTDCVAPKMDGCP